MFRKNLMMNTNSDLSYVNKRKEATMKHKPRDHPDGIELQVGAITGSVTRPPKLTKQTTIRHNYDYNHDDSDFWLRENYSWVDQLLEARSSHVEEIDNDAKNKSTFSTF